MKAEVARESCRQSDRYHATLRSRIFPESSNSISSYLIHRRQDHEENINHMALGAIFFDEELHCRSESSRVCKTRKRSTHYQLPTTRTIPPRVGTPARAPENHGTPTAEWHPKSAPCFSSLDYRIATRKALAFDLLVRNRVLSPLSVELLKIRDSFLRADFDSLSRICDSLARSDDATYAPERSGGG
ncbi:hypothetical protein CEP54_002846 [Fusarium duplospermum]|uniref:Uncharacterized protein n=1 Tax=Fusarium duplospermum TaxID=1325734 RepID=A0A428QSU8_9HYPO|nr:hypothetical protein CEP54_002846 [Fusarium duplospermum]